MPYTVGLLGSIPNPAMLGRKLTPIRGAPPSLMNLPSGCTFSPRCPLALDECTDKEPDLAEIGQTGHSSRCVRWQHLASIDEPRKLFVGDEIGVIENPAALVEAVPDIVQVEDLSAAQLDAVEKHLEEQREEAEESNQ